MKRIFYFLAALVWSLPLAAQTPRSPHKAATAETDSVQMFTLQSISVTATRATQHTPVAFTDVRHEQIASRNYGYDMPYLLQQTPSLVCTSEAGAGVGNTSLRLRGSDATRINVTANGVPMNDPASHKLYWVDTPDLASSVGSVQVQRGAGTSTNGTAAFGGAINLTTAPLQTRFGGDASMSYGSYNTAKQAVHVGSGLLGGHWAIDARLSHLSSDGYIDRGWSKLHSYMVQTAYYSGRTVVRLLSFGGWEQTYLTYNGLSRDQMRANRRYNTNGVIQHADGSVSFYDDQTDNYRQFNNQLIFSHRFSDRWTLNATAHYTSGYGYYNQYKSAAKMLEYGIEPAYAADGSKVRHDLTRRKSMQTDFYGVVASADYAHGAWKVSLGTALNRYDGSHWGNVRWVDGIEGYDTARQYYRNTIDKNDGNVFARATWTVAKGLDVYADMQYRHVGYNIDGHNDNYDSSAKQMQNIAADCTYDFLNPKVGVSYAFARHHNFYASLSVAHREPTRDDFTDRFTEAFPASERLLDWEAGYNYTGSRASAGVNLYYMRYHNQLVKNGQINDTDDALNINVPTSYRRGVELTASVLATRWLTLGANATFSQNRILDYTDKIIDYDTYTYRETQMHTSTISYSPSTVAAAFATVHTAGFELQWFTQYVGKQYMTNNRCEELSLDSYCVTNLTAAYTLRHDANHSVRFGVSVQNLFSARYCNDGYGYSYYADGKRTNEAYFFPQAPLNVLANVSVKF